MENLKKFKLTKEEQKKITGLKLAEEPNTYCRGVIYNGEMKGFCCESLALANSWLAAWVSRGGREIQYGQI